jgi:histidinol-phosphate aminotransferase
MSEFARNPGSETINVPLTGNYEVDFNVLLDRCDSRTALVYLCNPNNPTGTLAARKNIEPFLKKLPAGVMLVVDEAYHHFVTATSIYPSLLDYPTNDSRVIVTRTFSKLYGLAGIRVGCLVASPEVACNFPPNRVLSSVSGIAARAAAAALDDAGYLHIASRRNARDRQEFINQAGTRMLPVIDSHANFLMLKCPCPANEVFDHMNKHNIFLAPPVPEMNEYIRVSSGTPQLKCCNSGVSGIQCQFTPWPYNPLA